MHTNLAIDMTDNQCNVFDFNAFIDSSESNRNAIITKLGKSNAIKEDRENILGSMASIYMENDYKCRTEKEFWQWLSQNKKEINKINNELYRNNDVDADLSSDGGYNEDDRYPHYIPTDNKTPQTKILAEETPHKEGGKKETKLEIIDGDIISNRMIDWLNKVNIKTDEWQSVKKWAIDALSTDNSETRKQAITYSKMTKAQRAVWIISDYYYFINGGKINQTKSALFVYKVRGLSDSQLAYKKRKKSQKSTESYARQSYKAIMCRAALSAGINISAVKGFESEAKKVKRTNVILMADFIKQHKQLDFNFNRQKNKISVAKNKVVNGCSSGGKESVSSPSGNGLNTITKTIYAEIINNNINKNLADVNNKKTSNHNKILQFNAFFYKSINPTAINNNTFCQIIPLPDKTQQRFKPIDRQSHKTYLIIRRTKRRIDMLARDGP